MHADIYKRASIQAQRNRNQFEQAEKSYGGDWDGHPSRNFAMRTNAIFGHVSVFVPVSAGKYKFVIEHRQCPDGYSQLRSTTFTGRENRFHTYPSR